MNGQLVPINAIEAEARAHGLQAARQTWKVYAQDASRVESKELRIYGERVTLSQRITDGWVSEQASFQHCVDAAQKHGPGHYLVAHFIIPSEGWSSRWRGTVATVLEVQPTPSGHRITGATLYELDTAGPSPTHKTIEFESEEL